MTLKEVFKIAGLNGLALKKAFKSLIAFSQHFFNLEVTFVTE
jgi:hypothetical protein